MQTVHLFPKLWKGVLTIENENLNNFIIQEHDLIKKHQRHSLNKLQSK